MYAAFRLSGDINIQTLECAEIAVLSRFTSTGARLTEQPNKAQVSSSGLCYVTTNMKPPLHETCNEMH